MCSSIIKIFLISFFFFFFFTRYAKDEHPDHVVVIKYAACPSHNEIL